MSERVQYWSDHLAQIATEGISTKAYAEREGLTPSSLYYWRKRLKAGTTKEGQRSSAAASGRRFVAVQIADNSDPRVPCSLSVAGGVRLELAALPAPEWLAALVRAVSKPVR